VGAMYGEGSCERSEIRYDSSQISGVGLYNVDVSTDLVLGKHTNAADNDDPSRVGHRTYKFVSKTDALINDEDLPSHENDSHGPHVRWLALQIFL
jgi:hypothetical protein